MADVKITWWRNIPVSVMVKIDRENKANVALPDIYMKAVDAVATKTGAVTGADYAAGFHMEKEERDGTDARALAEQIAQELVEKFPRTFLEAERAKAGAATSD